MNTQYVYQGSDDRPSCLDVTFSDIRKFDELVIFLHGYKGFKDWGPWNEVAKRFSDAGFDFLKFNFSHNGGTVDNPIDFPDLEAFAKNTYSKELVDVDRVVKRAAKGFEVNGEKRTYKKFHLIGHSRGGGIAILHASRHPEIEKLVTWAAVSDFADRFNFDMDKWKEEGVTYIRNSRTDQMMPHNYTYYTDFVANRDLLDIPEAARQVNQPWLIAHGEKDEAVCISNADYLKSQNPNSELLIVSKTGHTFGARHPWDELHLPEKLDQLVQRTIKFLQA